MKCEEFSSREEAARKMYEAKFGDSDEASELFHNTLQLAYSANGFGMDDRTNWLLEWAEEQANAPATELSMKMADFVAEGHKLVGEETECVDLDDCHPSKGRDGWWWELREEGKRYPYMSNAVHPDLHALLEGSDFRTDHEANAALSKACLEYARLKREAATEKKGMGKKRARRG